MAHFEIDCDPAGAKTASRQHPEPHGEPFELVAGPAADYRPASLYPDHTEPLRTRCRVDCSTRPELAR